MQVVTFRVLERRSVLFVLLIKAMTVPMLDLTSRLCLQADLSNHYAAMPSMHFGYALWFCIATVGLLQGPPPRPAAPWPRRSLLGVLALYPPAVLFCIVVSVHACTLLILCCLILFDQRHNTVYCRPPDLV